MKVLTIFAHPDDETMLTGGTLALLSGAGAEMHYLCATRGEGGELGQPPVCSREEIGIYREKELIQAVNELGGGSLSFLGYIDPLIGENDDLYPYTKDIDGLAAKMIPHIEDNGIDVVITHGVNGEYGHPGHILTHKAVRRAVESLGKNAPLFYVFCADFPGHPSSRHANPDNPAHIILEVSQAMKQKIKAAYAHRSQNALFLRRRSREAGYTMTVPEILQKVESLHRVLPVANGQPDDELIQMLQPWEKV